MKKIIVILLILVMSSCKKDVKNNDKQVSTPILKEETAKYILKNAKSLVNFTAYKTTKKVGVNGLFKEIIIVNNAKGDSIKEVISGAEFEIPVNSIETNDSSRNFKIIKFFFATMKETMKLKGKVSLIDGAKGKIDLKMNGITEVLPFTYTIVDNVFIMNATMNTDKWSGQEATTKLNEICKDLHKGSDGVTKTWNVVDIKATFTF